MSMEIIDLLKDRKVSVEDIVNCVIYLEAGYSDEPIDEEGIYRNVEEILNKREVQHATRTAIALDVMAEQNLIEDKVLLDVILRDESLYGVDEVLAYGICNLYGSIALTNFGYIDRVKPGIIGELNDATDGNCNTHLDDVIGAIAASAASKNAHNR